MCQGVAKVFKGLLGLFTSANQESFFFFLTLGCIYFGEADVFRSFSMSFIGKNKFKHIPYPEKSNLFQLEIRDCIGTVSNPYILKYCQKNVSYCILAKALNFIER